MTQTIIRDGEEVGRVSFGPFEYDYTAEPENPEVRSILEATSVMTSPDTEAPDEEGDGDGPALTKERFVEPPPEARESALRRALRPTDHELVSDDELEEKARWRRILGL